MSEQQPNPYASDPGSGEYKWGPGNPSYGYPQPYPASPAPYPGSTPPYPGSTPPYPTAMPPVPATLPMAFPGPAAGGAPFSLGDITIAGDQIITPSGPMPLKGAIWNAVDFSRTEEKIPGHAIALAVIFAFFCLIGLLFLLMKERVTTGFVQVTVSSGGRQHSTVIPVTNPMVFPWVMSQLNHARSLSI
ncbi:hypothetical protein [Streptomyces sp. NPDC089799]|uniref:hypothetical protein n=1 Tax=Streptomyces sp. NPDC089799 TaxID=3155066 RepID=UPI003416C246